MAKGLSRTQERALSKLRDYWLSAYELQESIATLNVLVSRGLARARGRNLPGAIFCPRTVIEFRLEACKEE